MKSKDDLLPKPVHPNDKLKEESLEAKFKRFCDEHPGEINCRIDDN